MIEKFDVRVPEAVLDDLKERLARTRWPDQMDGVGWDYHCIYSDYARKGGYVGVGAGRRPHR